MGGILDRLIFLLKSQTKSLSNDFGKDIVHELKNRILYYINEIHNIKPGNIEKSFQEYLNKVLEFWNNTSSEQNSEDNKWKEQAKREFRQSFYTKFDKEKKFAYPKQILSYYKALEIEPGASPDEIKLAWKKLMKQYHPDLFNKNSEKQKVAAELAARITQAYQELMKFHKKTR